MPRPLLGTCLPRAAHSCTFMSLAAAPGVDGYKYTPSSGIWQTVWLEKVPSANYITNITITPTLNSAAVVVNVFDASADATTIVTMYDDTGLVVAKASGSAGQPLHLQVARPRLWSPDSPFLYNVTIDLLVQGSSLPLDTVESYIGLRAHPSFL